MPARIGVVMFPGSNCEHDAVLALGRLGASADLVWHRTSSVAGYDALILPGGFAHGDYLRPGAIARFSPVMEAVGRFAAEGGPVVGICNGFQVLTEAGLLPGALQKNRGLRFLCTTVAVRVESSDSVLTSGVPVGTELHIPINHFEGNYTCDAETLAMLRSEDRVVLRYVENPNGSIDDIAGVCNRARNVVGLMPHPERASDPLLGSVDGSVLLHALLALPGAGASASPGAGAASVGSAVAGTSLGPPPLSATVTPKVPTVA
jgi:phosphoribosylformylglycinamidine synthase